jgi:hypothetical protein
VLAAKEHKERKNERTNGWMSRAILTGKHEIMKYMKGHGTECKKKNAG